VAEQPDVTASDAPFRIELFGVPTDAGAGTRGSSIGPAALRIAGLLETLKDLGFAVGARGDMDVEHPRARHALPALAQREILDLARKLSGVAYDSLRRKACPVFMGGDHSLSMGSVAGVARYCAEIGRPLFILWVDAHADFNTPSISPTGNLHGMSLALLCGEEEFADTVDASWHAPVDPRNITILGARSIDREERNLLARRGVSVLDMRIIDETGVAPLMRDLIARVRAAEGHLHLSLDVDSIDPALAPGVGTTVPGGLTYREAHLIMEMLHDSDLVASLDIVELNPFLDNAGQSARLLVELAASLFGRAIIERASETRVQLPLDRQPGLG